MMAEGIGQLLAVLRSGEFNLRWQLQRLLLQRRALWSVANDRQPQLRRYQLQRFKQQRRAFVRNQPAHANQLARPDRYRVVENLVVIRVADMNRSNGQRLLDRVANGERRGETQDEAFQALLPASAAMAIRDPDMVRDEERTPEE